MLPQSDNEGSISMEWKHCLNFLDIEGSKNIIEVDHENLSMVTGLREQRIQKSD